MTKIITITKEYKIEPGAILIGADLSRADLRYADLSNAYLSFAYLSNADLSNADLRDANLYGAYVRDDKYNSETKFPEGFNPEEHDMIKVSDDD